MNEENTKKLVAVGRTLYSGSNKPTTKGLVRFGFECGDGWFQPIMELTYWIEAINIVFRGRLSVKAMQVKEKFGTLRFYFDIIPVRRWYHRLFPFLYDEEAAHVLCNAVEPFVGRMVTATMRDCEERCEKCGRQFYGDFSDRVVTGGYVRILCKECADKDHLNYNPFPKENVQWQTTKTMKSTSPKSAGLEP